MTVEPVSPRAPSRPARGAEAVDTGYLERRQPGGGTAEDEVR